MFTCDTVFFSEIWVYRSEKMAFTVCFQSVCYFAQLCRGLTSCSVLCCAVFHLVKKHFDFVHGFAVLLS